MWCKTITADCDHVHLDCFPVTDAAGQQSVWAIQTLLGQYSLQKHKQRICLHRRTGVVMIAYWHKTSNSFHFICSRLPEMISVWDSLARLFKGWVTKPILVLLILWKQDSTVQPLSNRGLQNKETEITTSMRRAVSKSRMMACALFDTISVNRDWLSHVFTNLSPFKRVLGLWVLASGPQPCEGKNTLITLLTLRNFSLINAWQFHSLMSLHWRLNVQQILSFKKVYPLHWYRFHPKAYNTFYPFSSLTVLLKLTKRDHEV